MVAQLSGMLGHIFVKVQLLSLARKLSEQCAGDCSRGMSLFVLVWLLLMPLSPEYLVTSIELAYEYSQLGRANRALSIYSHAVQAADKVTDPELQALLYLRHSESLAAAGQVLQRFDLSSFCSEGGLICHSASTYCEALALVDSLSSWEEKGTTTAEKVRVRVCTLERAALAARAFAMIQHARVGSIIALTVSGNNTPHTGRPVDVSRWFVAISSVMEPGIGNNYTTPPLASPTAAVRT